MMDDGGKGSGRRDTPQNAELVRKVADALKNEQARKAAEQKAKTTGARLIRKLNERRRK